MDWIEKLFGVSPDGGDGTAEVMIVLAFLVLLAAALTMRALFSRDRGHLRSES